ncbi:MAG: hypothetical protein ACMUJM_09460 [bacterium]
MKKVYLFFALIALLFFFIIVRIRNIPDTTIREKGNAMHQEIDKDYFDLPSNFHPDSYKDEGKRGLRGELKSKSGENQDSFHTDKEPSLVVKMDDIADVNKAGAGYILKEIDLYGTDRDILSTDFLSALKILNKKGMPSDYYQWEDYRLAYEEIDNYYSGTYIWPYFTNKEAKINFFLFLFSRYAADNKIWRSYEKDLADCSQFSQRIYLFLYPGEVAIEDEQYVYFLFSDARNQEERKKRCNKIPDIFYTLINPHIIKRARNEQPMNGHAMISFAPDNDMGKTILAEPQSGAFKEIKEDFRGILQEELSHYPLILRLGKIVSIGGDSRHEAKIKEEGIYFSPPTIEESSIHDKEDPRADYENTPILITTRTLQLCQLISVYLEQVFTYQEPDRKIFLKFLGDIVGEEEKILALTVDILMYSLINCENSDLRLVRDEMKEIEYFVKEDSNVSLRVRKLAEELNYILELKLKPFLE